LFIPKTKSRFWVLTVRWKWSGLKIESRRRWVRVRTRRVRRRHKQRRWRRVRNQQELKETCEIGLVVSVMYQSKWTLLSFGLFYSWKAHLCCLLLNKIGWVDVLNNVLNMKPNPKMENANCRFLCMCKIVSEMYVCVSFIKKSVCIEYKYTICILYNYT